jgi:ParB family chromosome partitioning protein
MVTEISVDLIQYSRTMLREIDGQTIADLKDSISEYGVLQPIVVFRNERDAWEVVCGNHRLCAARGVGLKTIPVVIRQCHSSEALLIGLAENIQRLEMNPIREGEIYYGLTVNSAYSSESIAKKINKGKAYVENRIRIFRNLHPKLKLELGKTLNLSNAVALSALGQNEQLVVYSKMKAVSQSSFPQASSSLGYGDEGFPEGYSSPYCVCEKCNSKHLRGVSVGDDKRAEKILSKMQK